MKIYLKDFADEFFAYCKESIEKEMKCNRATECYLSIVTVGDDPASLVYVNNKIKKLSHIEGLKVIWEKLDHDTTQEKLEEVLEDLSRDIGMSGVLLQLPLPEHLSAKKAIEYIDFDKDLDGLTSYNRDPIEMPGKQRRILPCTALGVIYYLDSLYKTLSGKTVLVIGRSDLVGRPLVQLVEKRNATVIWANSHTPSSQLKKLIFDSDIIISAAGVPNLITDEDVNIDRKQLFIDVGINRDENGNIVGDCNFKDETLCDFTAVPGGVGQLTTSMLAYNFLQCYKRTGMIL